LSRQQNRGHKPPAQRIRDRRTSDTIAIRHARRKKLSAGQAMIEFALVGGLLILVLLMGIQLAIIGMSDLAVNQYAYSVARYSSVNFSDTGLSTPGTDSNVTALMPPSLSASAATVTVAKCTIPAGASTVFGAVTTATVQYDLVSSNRIFLPNPFFGISLPTTVSATQKAFCE
jgi:Flp pilus assembly protein TadG